MRVPELSNAIKSPAFICALARATSGSEMVSAVLAISYHEAVAQNVAELTGWNVDEMRRKMHLDTASVTPAEKKWWEKIW